MARGALTISIDLEVAWGICDRDVTEADRAAFALEREIVRRLLDAFERHDVRATWAIVGHLMLDRCEDQAVPHPEIPRPVLPGGERDWFYQHPPEGAHDPLWHGRDLLEALKRATPRQDVGSHSFCHLSYAQADREAVRADVARARALHDREGLPFVSFVFPRNDQGRHDLLREQGIRVVRGRTPHWYQEVGLRPLRRAAHLLSYFNPLPPPTVRPTVHDGLVDVPDSMLLLGRDGLRRMIPPALVVHRAARALERAARAGEVFHLWFHPANFAHDTDAQFAVLERILERAAALRSQGVLDVVPMSDFPERTADPATTEQIRDVAIGVHDAATDDFEERYHLAEDPYATSFAYGRRAIDECLDAELAKLPAGARVLDVGCGTGMQLELLRRRGFDAVGVEPSPRMREHARERNPGAEVLEGHFGALPVGDGQFDFALSIEVLRYLHRDDIMTGYRDLFRALKPGGTFFFTMVNRWALDAYYPFYRLKRLLGRQDPGSRLHCEFVAPGEVESDLRACGFDEVETIGRLVLPLRIPYRVSRGFGARVARMLEPVDRALEKLPGTTALAGHLIVVARKPR